MEWLNPAVVSSVLSGVIAIAVSYLTQRRFWKYQRLAEQRLEVIQQVNSLASGFLRKYQEAEHEERKYYPDDDFHQFLGETAAKLQALFSSFAVDDYKKMERMIPSLRNEQGLTGDVNEFVEAHHTLMKTLYKEL